MGIGASWQPIPGCACLLADAAEPAVGQAGGRAVRAELRRAGHARVALAEVVATVAVLAQIAERAVAGADRIGVCLVDPGLVPVRRARRGRNGQDGCWQRRRS